MEIRMTKETGGIESDDRVKDRKKQCSDKKDEEMKLRRGKVTTREQWRKNNIKHNRQADYRAESDSREGGTKNGAGEERTTGDRRKDKGKKGSENRRDKREVDNRKNRGRKEGNSERGGGKSQRPVRFKPESFSETVTEGALRTERVFVGESFMRKIDNNNNTGFI